MRSLLSNLFVLCCPLVAAAYSVVGYYPSWAIYARHYFVTDIQYLQLTHINYAFANISNGMVVLGDPYADTEYSYPGDNWDDPLRGNFKQLIILKQMNPNLKTLISVGGWSWSAHFSDVALTPQSRETFANSCAQFVMQYSFDGVDLDWEYPDGGGNVGNIERPEDPANLVLLCQRIRVKMDSLEVLYPRQFLLTMALGSSQAHINNLDWSGLVPSLDFVNVMCYDFSGTWASHTIFDSPLYRDPANPVAEPVRSTFNSDSAMQTCIAAGIPRNKLVMGMPFYGKGYGNVGDANNGVYQPFSGTSPHGTWEWGSYDYSDLADNYVNQNGFTRYFHPVSRVPYLHNPTTNVWITYEDAESVHEKAVYVVGESLAGAMFWELSCDREAVLTSAINEVFSATPLSAPQEFTVYGVGDSLYFHWWPVPGATQYSLWSSPDPNAPLESYSLELTTFATSTAVARPSDALRTYFVRAQ